MAAPTLRSSPVLSSSTVASTSWTIQLPSGVQAGDLLVMWLGFSRSNTTVTGWTKLLANQDGFAGQLDIWYKVATGSEGSSVTCASSSSKTFAASVLDIQGVKTNTITTITNINTLDAPGLTTVADNALILTGLTKSAHTVNFTPPSGYSMVSDQLASTTGNLGIASGVQNVAGPVDPGVWSGDTGASGTATVTIALYDTASNIKPTASAGAPQVCYAGSSYTLNGSGSSDPDGTIAFYQWTVISADNSLSLSSTIVASPAFTAPNVAVPTAYC